MPNEVSEITRHDISDFFAVSELSWGGRFDDHDFLTRLYDLTTLPSYDGRFKTAAGDIYQHCVRNNDWDKNWIFTDRRFNLLHASDDELLRFLCETIHPVVRPDADEVKKLLTHYNGFLANDEWEIFENKKLSGRPVFAARKRNSRATVFVEATGWQKVDRQLQEVRSRLNEANAEEQYQAIGLLCREALISISQEVFDQLRHPILDGVTSRETDARRMLEAIFEAELKSSVNEEARAHAKAALRLALALQHKRTADFRMAALCAEATSSVVNLIAVLVGRRG